MNDGFGLGPRGGTTGEFGSHAKGIGPFSPKPIPARLLRVACDLRSLMPENTLRVPIAHALARVALAGHAVVIASADSSEEQAMEIDRRLESALTTMPEDVKRDVKNADPNRLFTRIKTRAEITSTSMPDLVVTSNPNLWEGTYCIDCSSPELEELLHTIRTSKISDLIPKPILIAGKKPEPLDRDDGFDLDGDM